MAADDERLRADARKNRDKIFEAAKQCFAEDAASASMETIARKAGVGVGSLYRAFGNRSGLAAAIYQDEVARSIAEANQHAASGDALLILQQWLGKYIARIITKRTMLSDLQPLFDRDPESLDRSRKGILAAVKILLEPAQQIGAVRSDVDEADLIALVNGTMTPGTTKRQALKRLDVILDGLRTPGWTGASANPATPDDQ